jgi:hypothetical protein
MHFIFHFYLQNLNEDLSYRFLINFIVINVNLIQLL